MKRLEKFPKPTDIPLPQPAILALSPDAGQYPAPDFLEAVGDNAPAIFMASPDTRPDETLALSGHQLTNAELIAWQGQSPLRIQPFQTADNRMLAILPEKLRWATTLIWPSRDGHYGRPVRINAADAWWSWPCRVPLTKIKTGTTLRVFGQSLQIHSAQPLVLLEGDTEIRPLALRHASPYELEAELPEDILPGRYRVWAHNGTGAQFGWSRPTSLTIEQTPWQAKLPVFRLDDYGASPNSPKDAAPALQKAIADAQLHGGGIIRFSKGIYRLGHPVKTPLNIGGGIHFQGAGKGRFQPGDSLPTGKCTILCPLENRSAPSHLLEINTAGSSLRHLAICSQSTGRHQQCLRLHAHDCVIEGCLIVLMDGRPRELPMGQRKHLGIGGGALFIDAPGKANIEIRDCHFHSAASGIMIGREMRDGTNAQAVDQPTLGEPIGPPAGAVLPERATDFVQVRQCTFRGYWNGLYKKPVKKKMFYYGATGLFQSGILYLNGNNGIVEHCDFGGADKKNGICINRSVIYYRSTMHNQFCAHNRSYDVGLVKPEESPRGINQGEQFLFHLRYTNGGYFDVTKADDRSVTLRTDDPRARQKTARPYIMLVGREESRIPEEVGKVPGWYAYIASGKGLGQYREIMHVERKDGSALLQLERPWRVQPDPQSCVIVTAAFRHNIVYDNLVDAGLVDPEIKVLGALFWFDAFENVIAENHFKNLSGGALFNTGFRHPVCWNQTRDNRMENISGYSADTSQVPAFYTDNYRCFAFDKDDPRLLPSGTEAGWYSVANMVRHNKGTNAIAAAMLHARVPAKTIEEEPNEHYAALPADPENGMMMNVFEHNHFQKVDWGIVLSPPANWTLLRKNHIQLRDKDKPVVLDQTAGKIAKLWKIND